VAGFAQPGVVREVLLLDPLQLILVEVRGVLRALRSMTSS